jgi:hypothetical protein
MQFQAAGEDVPPGVEFWNQDGVPEINVRVVGFNCLRGAHDQDCSSSKVVATRPPKSLPKRFA